MEAKVLLLLLSSDIIRRRYAYYYSLLVLVLLLWASSSYLAAGLSVLDFGAKPDGRSDSTQAFTRAWGRACSSRTSTVIVVPRGTFMIRPVSFAGPCRNLVTLWMDGTILAHPNYKLLESAGYFIRFYQVNRLLVRGGTVDARGKSYWACRRSGRCLGGATSLSFAFCSNVEVRGVRSVYSHRVHVSVFQSKRMVLTRLRLRAPSGSPNTDGIHLSNSNGITITNSRIQTGDDCISIGPGSSNFNIQKIHCGPGHGISIGSLANSYNEGGVEGITIAGVVFWKTDNGVRIKSWGRPSNSFVKNVVFKNIVMKNVYNPIIIDQRYCPYNNCPRQNSGVKISKVTYKNIRGSSASKVAVKFDCSPSHGCKSIKLHNINLTYRNNKSATSTCRYADGQTKGVIIPRSCL